MNTRTGTAALDGATSRGESTAATTAGESQSTASRGHAKGGQAGETANSLATGEGAGDHVANAMQILGQPDQDLLPEDLAAVRARLAKALDLLTSEAALGPVEVHIMVDWHLNTYRVDVVHRAVRTHGTFAVFADAVALARDLRAKLKQPAPQLTLHTHRAAHSARGATA